MTDDDLTPEQQEVRRLLAESRHDQAVPDEVAARLDRVLAELADEPGRSAQVTELATRRRRASGLLVAAAAVIAVGIGVSQVIDTGTTSEDALSSADRGESAGDVAAAEEAQPDGDRDDGAHADKPEAAGQTATQDGEPADLTALNYAEGVMELRVRRSGLAAARSGAFDALGSACRAEVWGEGRFVAVRYDDVPGVLVFRRAVGDTQVVDLFLCGDEEPRRSITLPAP